MKLGSVDKAYLSQRPKKVVNLEKEYSRLVTRGIGNSQYGGTTNHHTIASPSNSFPPLRFGFWVAQSIRSVETSI